MKKLLTIITSAIILTVFAVEVNAQNTGSLPLVVAPARQQISINPGDKESGEIKFYNFSKDPVKGNVRVVDFIVQSISGAPKLLEDGSIKTRFSAASWITLSNQEVTIASEDVVKIPFSVSSPADAAPGGRYAAIYFEPTGAFPQQAGDNESFSATIPRVVGLVSIRVNGPIEEGAVVSKIDYPKFVEFGPVNIKYEVTNQGALHITPQGQVTMYNWFGKIVQTQDISNINIFPDAAREYDFSFGKRLMIGKYKVSFNAIYGDSNNMLTSQIAFWAFPIRLFLIIVLSIVIIALTAIIIWSSLKGRQKRLEKKLESEIDEIETLKNKYKDTVSSKETKK